MSEVEQSQDLFSGSFEELGLSQEFLDGLKDLGYQKPTIVQKQVFAPVQEGRDLIVQSRTGSGKTTAFSLPVLNKLDQQKGEVQALVLVPTRELARQVATESGRLGHHVKLKIAAIYGGASFHAQTAALQAGAQIVVGTPGRVKDLIDRRILKLDAVKFAVLDEADEMLSMGFWDDVTYILGKLPKERQTLLFSATIPDAIASQLPQFVNDPIHLNLSSDTATAKTIRHVIHKEDDSQPKARNLLNALEVHHPQSSIVFCNTKEETQVIEQYLRRFGFNARALNGDMAQSARERVMKQMRDGNIDLIVATDVAARGIDISGISHVFNVELPSDSDVYVHRTGRTGRIGKLGVAVNLVRAKDAMQIDELKQKFDLEFEEIPLPPESDIMWMQAQRLSTLFVEAADSVEISQYRKISESMVKRADLAEIVAFLLRSYFSHATAKPVIADAPNKEESYDSSRRSKGRSSRFEKNNAREIKSSTRIPSSENKLLVIRDESKTTIAKPEVVINESELARDDSEVALEISEEHHDFLEHDDSEDQNRGTTTLYITLGRDDGFKELVELCFYLANESDVDFGYFTGMGQLRDSSSHVEIESEFAQKVIDVFNDKDRDLEKAKGTNASNPKILCEVAKDTERKPRMRRGRRR